MFKIKEFVKNAKIKKYIFIVIYQLIIISLFIFCYDYFFKQKIGVVNITGITNVFIKLQSKENITAEELKKRVHIFAVSLEKGLHVIGARNRVVLMPAEAVITGAQDYTKDVQRYLAKILPNNLPNEAKQTQVIEAGLEDSNLSQGRQANKLESVKDEGVSYTNTSKNV